MALNSQVNLKALTGEELKEFLHRMLSLPPFRARQLRSWLYDKKAASIDDITELSKDIRERLGKIAHAGVIKTLATSASRDGTVKYLFGLDDEESIESVLIPDEDRLTLCVSSQSGCRMGCRFCLTGKVGFRRNLAFYEIVEQILAVSRDIAPDRHITNVVLMGMGEPLDNYVECVRALKVITGESLLSKRHITLSTCGVVPEMKKLFQDAPEVNLAISLNATTDSVRDSIMPINRRYRLDDLLSACKALNISPRRRITFEYVMLRGINDSLEDARRLPALLKGIRCKVNLIPFNEYDGTPFKAPLAARVLEFQKILHDRQLTVLIRKSKGADILAACGQLKAMHLCQGFVQ